MIILQIHSMFWADEAQTCVGLIADTDTGTEQLIGTPYDETSIIWADVSVFPVEEIAAYVPPAV